MRVLLLLLLSFSLYAKLCTEIDLSHKFGPIQNQHQTGWCYAFVAADMLSYELKEKGFLDGDQYISALASAALYNYNSGEQRSLYLDFVNGQKDEIALAFAGTDFIFNQLQEEGIVLRSQVNQLFSFDEVLFSLLEYYQGKISDSIEGLKTLLPKSRSSEIKSIVSEGFFENRDPIYELLYGIQDKLVIPDSLHAEVKKVFLCPRYARGASGQHCVSSFKRMVQRLDEILLSGAPVGISYYTEGVIEGKFSFDGGALPAESPHKSLIVGKSCDGRFILRNSWGKDSCQRDYRTALDRFVSKESSFHSTLNPDYKHACEPQGTQEIENEDHLWNNLKKGIEGDFWKSYNFTLPSKVSQACTYRRRCLAACPNDNCRQYCDKYYYRMVSSVAQLPFSCENSHYIVTSEGLSNGINQLVYLQ